MTPFLRRIIFFLVLSGTLSSQASVRVAFLELRKWNGEVLVLEPDFRYAHVAVSEGAGWWHAHPRWGVENISDRDLQKVGKVKLLVLLPESEKLDPRVMHLANGIPRLPYDTEFSWSDAAMYCSELVAKLLRLRPKPMHFDPSLWPPQYQALEGSPGISPGGIYRELMRIFSNARCELADGEGRGTFSCSDSYHLPIGVTSGASVRR